MKLRRVRALSFFSKISLLLEEQATTGRDIKEDGPYHSLS
jgi:hypothetical protein